MGSFNVACSISNISISVGTQVVFFPLLPRKSRATKYLLEANAHYQPFCLPIKGAYNDYGSLEEIVRDDNTQALEAFFGIDIETFVENIGRGVPKGIKGEEKEALYQQLSGMFVHRAIYDELIAFDLQDKHLANDYVTKEIAQFYGFVEVPKEEQVLIDNYHSCLMRKKGCPYELKIGTYGAVLLHERHKEYYTFAFDQRYGKEIKQHWKQATGTDIHDIFPKEYHFEQLTNEQYLYVKEKFKELTGAPLGYSEDEQDKYSIYSVEQFAAVYAQLTGESIDVTVWQTISQYDTQYTKFQEALRNYKPEKRTTQERLAQTTDETQRKLLMQLIQMEKEIKHTNDFGFEANALDFARFFNDMEYFKALYMPLLVKGALRELLKEYQAFYWSMVSCNRFFFPAMNGEQFGNAEASYMLLKKSMEIVQNQLSEMTE